MGLKGRYPKDTIGSWVIDEPLDAYYSRSESSMTVSEAWWIGKGVIAILLCFQFFLRYQYVTQGGAFLRIDRITGLSI